MLLFTFDLGVVPCEQYIAAHFGNKSPSYLTHFPEDPTTVSAVQDAPADTSLFQGTSIFPNQIRTTLIKGKQEVKVR